MDWRYFIICFMGHSQEMCIKKTNGAACRFTADVLFLYGVIKLKFVIVS